MLAILPFYFELALGLAFGVDLRALRVFRCIRIVRLAKLTRYSEALQTFQSVILARREQLIASLAFVFMALLLSSSLLYYAERDVEGTQFTSIPASMWWAVATLTTVGYGDMYPVTPVGRLLASLVAVLGVGVFALPTAILGAGFVEAFGKRDQQTLVCPHCGKNVNGAPHGEGEPDPAEKTPQRIIPP